jgi:hypothetical protein
MAYRAPASPCMRAMLSVLLKHMHPTRTAAAGRVGCRERGLLRHQLPAQHHQLRRPGPVAPLLPQLPRRRCRER